MPSIFFAVTNDLVYDQRMKRICTSLSISGYPVTIIGRKRPGSLPLEYASYKQVRLACIFDKGKLFYLEFNIRLFIFLLLNKMDGICAVDVDSILACYYASKLKKIKRILDAHEFFSQQKEIITRPAIYKIWHWIERKYLPEFSQGYTVSDSLAAEFKNRYGVSYEVIRNMPLLKKERSIHVANPPKKIILYQGAVNEARGFEFLIPAMQQIEAVLHIYGEGNFVRQVKELIASNNLDEKVLWKGPLLPVQLERVAREAYIGVNLVENEGLNQYYSLANKFFDYIHNGIPQVTMEFPEYVKINEVFRVAVLIKDLQISSIAQAINQLLKDEHLYRNLQQNCLAAREKLNWQEEEKKLISFYKNIFG